MRLSAPMKCDNYDLCQASTERTRAQARAKGWHIFEGTTMSGEDVTWILCPACVGKRGQVSRAPVVLEGQEELF